MGDSMSDLIAPTTTLSPNDSSAVMSALASATASDGQLAGFNNASSLQFDAWEHNLTSAQTGCLRQGTLPVALATNDTCYPGFYCPNSSDQFPPQFCPPTEPCQVLRASKGTCAPQGAYEPVVCSAGRFCPPNDAGKYGKQMLDCPKGTFCPQGSFQPTRCSFGAICPAKSSRQIQTVPLFLVIAIDIALAIVVAFGFGISKWRKSRPKKYASLVGGVGGGKGEKDDIELLRSPGLMGQRSPRVSISGPGESPGLQPFPSYHNSPDPSRPTSVHSRRASGRSDYLETGYGNEDPDFMDDTESMIDDEYHNNPEFQRFLRSMLKTIETDSVGLSFDFENLSFDTTKGKKILQDVTGTMPRGSCWGVMGGSGAGKSTFLNVLMGKLTATGGSLKVNGWSKEMSKYKKLVGYVPQDDIVFPELTVRENILHSARVRLPAKWRDAEIQLHVDSLIDCLQLSHVQHSRVGDATNPVISGGQRKRVNIGLELAAAPMAIFLDEPTSGLDSGSAASIMKLLSAVSKLGVTVISIIHQPREQIFYGFDQLLLLSQGRSVYSGPTESVQNYFEGLGFAFPQRANVADTLIDIITGDGAQYTVGRGRRDCSKEALIEEWKLRGQHAVHGRHLSVGYDAASVKRNRRISNQSLNSTVEQEDNLRRTMQARGATWIAQAYYCFKRSTTQQIRNSSSFFFEIGVGALAGIIIGLSAFAANGHLFQGIYMENFTELSSAVDYSATPQLGLLGAMAIGLAASAPGFWVFGEEKMMYWREAASGHSRSAYYVGKLLSTLLRIALSSLHFTVFLGVLATPLISFQKMYAANLMYFWCIYGLASVVSMLVARENGPLLAVLASLIIGVLGGVSPPLRKVKMWHMEWLWRASPGVWFTEAYFTENLTPMGYLYRLDYAAQAVGFTLGQYALDIAILFAIGAIYRIVAYFALILVKREKQR